MAPRHRNVFNSLGEDHLIDAGCGARFASVGVGSPRGVIGRCHGAQ